MAQHTQSTNPFGSGFDGMMKANAHNMESLAQSYGAFLHRLGRLNADTMSFCAERWKEDVEVSARIARSKAPEDVAEVCSGFFLKMFTDYSEQAQRVIDTMGELGPEKDVTVESDAPAEPSNAARKTR
ncbi:phasin family protein [Nitratireductor sp. XY-223]|uniref:phasin family protein n=1 Tax=Nitratireductor sp. XY-223 TaxID=2561926 RepID=UPI0010AACD0D|nr:phasin family protein [Nitratireductor sp. XY-223]